MLWEHEPQASVSTAFSSSAKLLLYSVPTSSQIVLVRPVSPASMFLVFFLR